MVSIRTPHPLQKAEANPAITAEEAFSLLKTQLDQFLNLVKTLDPADWSKPTACRCNHNPWGIIGSIRG